jgi:hypothetical protein
MNRSMLFAIILAASVPAIAQTPPGQAAPQVTTPSQSVPAPKIDPIKEADIRKLLEISGNAKLAEEMVATSTEQLRTSILKSLPEGEHSQKILDSFLRRYKVRFTSEQLTALIIPIYDKCLSDEDIKGLIEFYQSPLGQRAVKALPSIAREAQQSGFDFGQKVVQQVIKEVQDEFPELKPGQPPEKP